MTEVLKKISVDLSRRGNTRLIFARQNDRGSRRVAITLTDCGKPYTVPKSTVATINILRSDGESSAFAADVTDGGEVGFTLPLWALTVSGEARCSVSLYGAECKLTSADFTLDVVDALYLGNEIAEDAEADLLSALLSEVAAFKEDELERVSAENKREIAENERISAENERSLGETLRESAEKTRNTAEKEREDAEEYRVLGESQRNRNESYRFETEESRKTAEAERVDTETARVTAEESRKTAEADRAAAEKLRIKSERAREAAEAERAEAEVRRNEAISAPKPASEVTITDEGGRFASEDVEGALDELAESLEAQNDAVETLKTRVDASAGSFGKLTLQKSAFDAGLVAEVEIGGAGALDLISFYPESAEDADIAAASGLFVLPQAAFGRVIFTVKSLPESDLNFCYFITKGGAADD